MFAHSVEPELVDMATVLLPRQLDTPLATVFVGLVLPSGNDALLHVT